LNLGAPELLIILAVVMLLFGAAKLPKLARSLGESAKEFQNATAALDSVSDTQDQKP
jgi:sec-independent protein translocase protein TatA